MAGSVSGKVLVDVEADVSRFASQLAKDLNEAIKKVRLDMSPITRQMTEGFDKGTKEATDAIERLTERATKSFNQVADAATRMGSTIAGSMNESVGSVSDRIVQIENGAARAAATTSAAFQRAGRSISGLGDQMTYGVTLPIVGVGVAGVKTAADFEKSMNLVRAVSGVTGDEFQTLRKQAVDLGASTQFSASEAAQAMYYLSSAGFDATQMYQAMPGVLNLAAAGAVDLATAADIAANVLNGFGMKAADLGRVNDVLAKAMAATAVDMRMLNDSFKYAGPIASSLGLKFEETAAAIGLMGNAGIKGEMAGTALRGALARLIDPPKEASNALRALGVSVNDSHGKMLPLVDIMAQLEKKGATTADMMKIFGLEAGPGMQALLSQGSGSLRKLTSELQNAGGTADRMAKIQMQGFSGAWDNLTSSIEGLTIAIGDSGVLQDLTNLVTAVTNWVTALSKSNPEILKAVFYFAMFAAAVGPILAVIGRVITFFGSLIKWAGKLGDAIKWIAKAVGLAAGTFSMIVAAVVVVVGALIYAYFHVQRFRDICDSAFRAVAAAAMWLWNNGIKPAFSVIWTALQQVGAFVLRLWQTSWLPALRGMGDAVMAAWNNQIKPAFSQLGNAFKDLGRAVVDWWNKGGREAFQNAGKVMSMVWNNVILPGLKAVIVVLGALAYALYWVFLNVAIPLFTGVVKALTFVVNAFTWLTKAVTPVWQFLNMAFHAIGAAAMWLWSNAILPAFNGVVSAAKTVWSVYQFLWGIAVAVFNGIASVVRVFWSVAVTVFNAVSSAISAVVSVVMWFYNTFSPLFIAIGQLVWSIWSGVFSIVFSLLKAGFDLIVTVVVGWYNMWVSIWGAVANLLSAVWNGFIWPILSAIGNGFMILWNTFCAPFFSAIGSALSTAGGWFMSLWNGYIWPAISAIGSGLTSLGGWFASVWSGYIWPAISAIGSAFTWLWNNATSVWNGIVSAVSGAVSRVVAVGASIASWVAGVVGNFTNLVNSVRSRCDNMAGVVSSIPGRISDAVGNLANLLYNAGQNVVNGLINGITSKINALRDKASQVAGVIRDHLPFSPAKEGPLSGHGDPTIAGGVIVQMIATGIEDKISALRDSAWSMAAAASPVSPAGPAYSRGGIFAELKGGSGGLPSSSSNGTTIVFNQGAIMITFSGATPTEQQARAVGEAVGSSIAGTLAKSNTTTQVRMI